MNSAANVTIHSSQFPENVRRDLLASLRSRKINHKFHYDSVKQTQKWLALHQIYSPSRHDENVRAIYEQSFEAAAAKIKSKRVHVVGLGCGGGQKDTRLLKLLKSQGKEIFYTPCDVSSAMVLTARQTALAVLPEKNCFPLVCDLAVSNDMPTVFNSSIAGVRMFTFFGMIPNFEPQEILPKLASLIRPGDSLLFSANLAPGRNYSAGMDKIFSQYNNELTRAWLMTFLLDLGIETADGELRFEIENATGGLKRIVANFYFSRSRQIEIDSAIFKFAAKEKIRLFFSYRYTSKLLEKSLVRHGLKICRQWISNSEEEGVFLCEQLA